MKRLYEFTLRAELDTKYCDDCPFEGENGLGCGLFNGSRHYNYEGDDFERLPQCKRKARLVQEREEMKTTRHVTKHGFYWITGHEKYEERCPECQSSNTSMIIKENKGDIKTVYTAVVTCYKCHCEWRYSRWEE